MMFGKRRFVPNSQHEFIVDKIDALKESLNRLKSFALGNPRSGWKHKAWGGAERNPRTMTAKNPERATRARAQDLRPAHDESLSPTSRAQILWADDPEVPLRSTPGFMLSPRFAGSIQPVQTFLKFVGRFVVALFCALAFIAFNAPQSRAQNPTPNTETLKKANPRPAEAGLSKAEPWDGATVAQMTGQCVTLDTESGAIVFEVLPAKAPETVRSFLNLAATGALDSTIFSRVVKGFVIQGGNLSTSEKWNAALAVRMSRHLPDEPSDVKHVRGIVSMARGEEANSATTHFFILVGAGPHLDGTFTAFGRVIAGIEVADAINRAPSENETPTVPVRIKHAGVAPCQK